jgi:aryl-phospho-beta-D-glucosidase BglC (GH1 family)
MAPAARALLLSRGAFPRTAQVQGGTAGNLSASRASDIHTAPLAALGRTVGVVQTARWTVFSQGQQRHISIQYLASVFAGAASASAAFADASSTLWEAGQSTHLPGLNGTAFTVRVAGGKMEDYATSLRGAVELELRLRYPLALDQASTKAAVAGFVRTTTAAERRVDRLVPDQSPPVTSSAIPPIAVAPSGVGPVVKSPSMIGADAASAPGGSRLFPGEFHAVDAGLSKRATAHPDIVPRGAITRWTDTFRDVVGQDFYGTVALYGSPQNAADAFGALSEDNAKLRYQREDTTAWRADFPSLAALPQLSAWTAGNESFLAFRQENVVETVADAGGGPSILSPVAARVAESVPSWLSAKGTQIVNGSGQPIYLEGLNWYGAEEADFIVGGLDFAPYGTILQAIKQQGFNSIRIPFSNQMVEQNPVITDHLGANPELRGLHALDILDRVIQYAGALGLSVILDNHRNDAGWSSQTNGLWYDANYPDSSFVHDWSILAQRYSTTNVVVGADLHNEPHGTATWGDGNLATDWRLAAQRAGDAALAANPHILVMVEGVQYYAKAGSYWWGGNLMGVATAPVDLEHSSGASAHDRLVYSVHDYGPDLCGGGCPWFAPTTTYASLAATWDSYWGYIVADPSQPYAAPVWIGEFGTCNQTRDCVAGTAPGSQGQWFASIVQYIAAHHLGWSYWPANGTMSTAQGRTYGALDWYGYFSPGWSQPVAWLAHALQPIEDQGAQTGSGTP